MRNSSITTGTMRSKDFLRPSQTAMRCSQKLEQKQLIGPDDTALRSGTSADTLRRVPWSARNLLLARPLRENARISPRAGNNQSPSVTRRFQMSVWQLLQIILDQTARRPRTTRSPGAHCLQSRHNLHRSISPQEDLYPLCHPSGGLCQFRQTSKHRILLLQFHLIHQYLHPYIGGLLCPSLHLQWHLLASDPCQDLLRHLLPLQAYLNIALPRQWAS